jgi:hypothetical protein
MDDEYEDLVDDERQSRRERDKSERGLRCITPPRYYDKRFNKHEFELCQKMERSLDQFRTMKENNAKREILGAFEASLGSAELFNRLKFSIVTVSGWNNNPILFIDVSNSTSSNKKNTKEKRNEPKKSTQMLHDFTLDIQMRTILEVQGFPSQQNKLLLLVKGGPWAYETHVHLTGENEPLRAMSQEELFEDLQKKYDENPDAYKVGMIFCLLMFRSHSQE